MALLHRATITPTKLELVEGWAPAQPWCAGGGFSQRGAYRFDDPAGEVGIETLLLQASSGPLLQVPLSYRDAPLAGAEEWLIGTMQHSVLGERWVYDGVGDPVVVAAFVAAIEGGGIQAEQRIEIDGAMVLREPTATVQGSGSSGPRSVGLDAVSASSDERETVVDAGEVRLVVRRVLDGRAAVGATLSGGPVGEPALVLAEIVAG
ncbi:hypothetical protein HQQ81_13100 [Microbacteriaceae bacterium VKM Ac-2854]|nr:hypothetical protein [Microbacteriaceae bacterium VKM Ac-2854]